MMKCQARRAHFSPMSLEGRHRVGKIEVPLINTPLRLGLLTLARRTHRRRLFSMRCFGVSAPVTRPPVASMRGGSSPENNTGGGSVTAPHGHDNIATVLLSLLSLAVIPLTINVAAGDNNSPSAPSSRGGCAVRFGFCTPFEPHHFSPRE